MAPLLPLCLSVYIHLMFGAVQEDKDETPLYSFPTDCSQAASLLQSLYRRLWFHMWHLFCPHLFHIFPSFGSSEGLYFVIVAFPGILTYIFVIVCLSSFLLSVPREGCTS